MQSSTKFGKTSYPLIHSKYQEPSSERTQRIRHYHKRQYPDTCSGNDYPGSLLGLLALAGRTLRSRRRTARHCHAGKLSAAPRRDLRDDENKAMIFWITLWLASVIFLGSATSWSSLWLLISLGELMIVAVL